jgi:outer membrane protein
MRVLILALLLAMAAAAGERPQAGKSPLVADDGIQLLAPSFPKPSYFRQTLFNRPERFKLEAPGTLRGLAQDGKLNLTVADVVRLVVQRNTSVWLARLDVENSGVAVLRSQSPFDPRFSRSFASTRVNQPTSSNLEAGRNNLVNQSLTQAARFSYDQAFASGTAYNVSFTGGKLSTNNQFSRLNPSITSAMGFSLTQPLMRNRGFFVQRAPIIIAGINRQVSRGKFEQVLTDTVQQAINQYWSVVQARENLAVLRNSLALSQKSYERDSLALKLGALPPLDIYRSEAEVANRKVAVTTAEYTLTQQEDALRRLIAADIDPDVRDLPLNLMDPALPPATLLTVNQGEAIETALRKRPELGNLRRQQVIDDINIRQAANGLKPDVRLTGSYTANGLGRTYGPLLPDGTSPLIPGGLGDALSELWGFSKPTYGFGLTLNFPIRSRQAQADMAAAQIAQKRDMYQERDLQQSITLEVRNAVNQLEQSKANIVGATAARDLAKKNEEAEQRKYDLGASTIFFVLDAQQRASDAETQLLGARIAYKKAVVALERTAGTLLEENNVVITDALALK